MALVSIVMLAAFAAVYTVTWRNIQLENRRVLDAQIPTSMSFMFSAADNPPESGFYLEDFSVDSEETYTIENNFAGSGFMSVRQVSLDYSLSFSVEIDGGGNIVTINSIIDIPRESYETAVKKVLAQNRDSGIITLDKKTWMYQIGPYRDITQFFSAPDIDIEITDFTQKNRQISFLDVTESNLTLRNLLITLCVIGIFVLFIFYFISLYFSGRAVKPLIEACEKQKHFIADASHELKTPLTVIAANCDALLENGQETVESQRKWIDYIKAGTDRMTRLAGQLLTLAKMDNTPDTAVPLEDTNISKLALDAVYAAESIAANRGLKIVHSIESGVVLKSDGEKFTAVVMILLENAVKYADSQIEATLKKEKRHVKFTVKNDGKGIAPEELPKVFDRFYRGDKSRESSSGGCGLGLSIAKSITYSLGGEISAYSEWGGYTVFNVTLPALS